MQFSGGCVPDLPINGFLFELMPVATSGIGKDEMVRYFIDVIRNYFGVEYAKISEVAGDEPKATVTGYLQNTKKPYIDNQLSDYSSFAELVGYKNQGYFSYAAIPIMADGRMVSMLEMLSHSENKFSQELVSGASLGALLIGFALAYKSESGRSNRLAGYFDTVFNSANPQVLVSSDGSIVKANKSAMREFGIGAQDGRAEAALGADFAKLSSATGTKEPLLLRTGSPSRIYWIFPSKVNDRLLYVSAQDMTDATSLRSVLQALNAGEDALVVFTDENLRMVGATNNFERLLGYEKGIMMGKGLTELIDVKDRDRLVAELSSTEAKPPAERKIDLLKIGGYPLRAHFSAAKSLTGYSVMFVKADSEKYVEDLKSGLSDFINNTSDIIITIDGLGYIRSANMSTESILGYTRDELNGKELRSLYDDQAVLDRDLAYAKGGGRPDNSYVTIIRKDGQRVPGTQSIRMLTDPDGEPSYIIGVKELLTKRILDDQELRIGKDESEMKKLRATGDLKSMFIYNISHERKTPLTNIKGFAKLVYEGDFGKLNEDQMEYVKTISDEADRLMAIIQQVLDAAKLDASKVKLELKEVDLGLLGDNPSIKALEESATSKGLDFAWKVDYDVPKILADPNRLMQIFVNLIGNSIKFTDTGGITVHIAKKSRKRVQCDVIDTGIGISEGDLRSLFKKFYQVSKNAGGLVKQDGSGTGLGLSITKDLVRLHGGEMFVESQVGKGSKFSFTLKVNPRSRKK